MRAGRRLPDADRLALRFGLYFLKKVLLFSEFPGRGRTRPAADRRSFEPMQTAAIPAADRPSGLLFNFRQFIADAICPENRERRESAERAANFDALTGVASRRAFELALPRADADPSTAVVVFDANNFKAVNDRAGHLAGDAMLRQLARAIFLAADAYGFGARVFRIGGDEFAVICTKATADLIRDDAEEGFGARSIGGFPVSVSGTVGASFAEADALLQSRKSEAKGA
jgi:GGDEF domain-containing protein